MKATSSFLRTVRTLLPTLLLPVTWTPFAQAVNYHWNLPGGGEFSDTANWDETPGTGTHRYFSNNASGTIEFTGNATMTGLYFHNTSGTLILDLGDHALNTSNTLDIGNDSGSNNNHVTLQGGAEGSFSRFIMRGSDNTIILNQTQLSGSNQYLRIQGTGGNNTLRLENGASLSFSAAASSEIGRGANTHNNQVIITGTGSELNFVGGSNRFSIGQAGSSGNVLRVEEGGRFVGTSSQTVVGYSGATNNRLEIDGEGSTAQTRTLLIGSTNVPDTSIPSTGNVVSVTDGGQLTVSNGTLQVGGSNAGSINNRLEIDGGRVIADEVNLGEFAAQNTIQVLNNGSLQVGAALRIHNGTLEVDQGTITTNQFQVDANASVDFRSGTIASQSGNVQGTFQIGDGTDGTAVYRLTNASQAHNFTQGLTLSSNARLEGLGTLNAAVQTSTDAVVAVGYETGSSKTFGVLTIDQSGSGSWDNDGVTLIMGIGDLSTGSLEAGTHYDLLSFGSGYTFDAGGAILVDLTYYQALSSGSEEFRILAWENFSGDWENIAVSFSGVTSDLSYQFQADGLYITAVPEPETLALLLSLPLLATVVYLRRNRHIIQE